VDAQLWAPLYYIHIILILLHFHRAERYKHSSFSAAFNIKSIVYLFRLVWIMWTILPCEHRAMIIILLHVCMQPARRAPHFAPSVVMRVCSVSHSLVSNVRCQLSRLFETFFRYVLKGTNKTSKHNKFLLKLNYCYTSTVSAQLF
jgi:hypothetical protein